MPQDNILNYHIKNVNHATYVNADNVDNVKGHVCMNILIRYKKLNHCLLFSRKTKT